MTAVSAAGVLVAACQPQVVKETVEVEKVVKETVIVEVPKGATEAVTLRYVFVADPGELEVRQACILDFMKKFPEIRIDGELVPEDGMGQKILTQLAGGAAPDMTYYNNTPLPLYATENVLIPLDDYAERDAGTFQPDDFFAGPLADMGYGGKQYGYPYYSGPWMLVYNKTLFEKLGVPLPSTYTEGYDVAGSDVSDKWTWDNFLILAKQLVSGEGVDKTWGYIAPRSLAIFWKQILTGHGAKIWSDGYAECLINSPESVEAHQFQVDMIVKDKVAPTTAEGSGIPGGFMSGKYGMYRMLRAAAPGYKEITEFEMGEVVIPHGPNGRFTGDGPNAVGIIASCQNKEEAWTFCKYLPGNEPNVLGGQEFEFQASRSVPTRKSNFGSQVFIENLLPWEDAKVYQAAASHVIGPARPGRWQEIERAWREKWDAMGLGQPVQEALDDLCEIIKPFLAEG